MSETAMVDVDKLRAELAAARAEIMDLKQALVTMCDVYSANREEKLRVKAFRRHASNQLAAFSLAEVADTFTKLSGEQRSSDAPPKR